MPISRMPISRRLPAAIAALVASTLLLAGCGTVTPEGAADAETITVTDDQDREVTINGPVERAVVLNSYGNEFVRAIGAGDTVVGVDRASINRLPYLPVDENDVIAEGLDQINYEAVAELDPDVVIMPRNAVWQEAAEQLESFGIPVVVATAWDYAVFEETVSLLGQVFQKEEGAKAVTDFSNEILDVVAERTEGVEPVPVYWETVDPYLTVLPGSGFHAIIEAAGGSNVFENAAGGGDEQEEITVDPAEVVTRNPAVIVHEFEPSATPTGQERFDTLGAEVTSRPGWSNIDAIKNGEVYLANGWAMSAVAKSIGALYLAKWLHPEEFADVNPDEFLECWVVDFQQTDFPGASEYIQQYQAGAE